MKRISTALLTLAVGVITTAPSSGDEPERGERRQKLIEKIDGDGDGEISKAEARKAREAARGRLGQDLRRRRAARVAKPLEGTEAEEPGRARPAERAKARTAKRATVAEQLRPMKKADDKAELGQKAKKWRVPKAKPGKTRKGVGDAKRKAAKIIMKARKKARKIIENARKKARKKAGKKAMPPGGDQMRFRGQRIGKGRGALQKGPGNRARARLDRPVRDSNRGALRGRRGDFGPVRNGPRPERFSV